MNWLQRFGIACLIIAAALAGATWGWDIGVWK